MGIKDLFSKSKDIEPKVLLESNSPNCNIQAIVEADNRCVYLYLFGQPDNHDKFMSSCWVRNYEKAPKEIDVHAMRAGKAPMMPFDCCSHTNGTEKLEASELEIVWFEEGDGAALLYKGEILCVIPSWSNQECPGYSKDCIKESQFAWPLGDSSSNVLFARVRKAKEFWDGWNDNSWDKFQQVYLGTIEKSIGKYNKYYAIDGGYWPPKAMITIEKGNLTYVITLGVSIIPQPKVEMYFEEPREYRRFEFGFIIETELLNKNRNGILSYISAQTSLPWNCLTWLGHGHTIPCDQIFPEAKEFPFVIFINTKEINKVPVIDLPAYREDPINILWMVPITSSEKKYAEDCGSEVMIDEHTKDIADLLIFRWNSKFNI